MPLYLSRPSAKNPNFRLRGTYLGVGVDESLGTRDRRLAQQLLRQRRAAIERGALAPQSPLTFAEAALAYMQAGHSPRFLERLLRHFGETPLSTIDQVAADAAAAALYPKVRFSYFLACSFKNFS